jgi:hypothetical protein
VGVDSLQDFVGAALEKLLSHGTADFNGAGRRARPGRTHDLCPIG